MLLTLSVQSLKNALGGRKPKLSLYDTPRHALEEYGLHGLCLQTSFLAGWDLPAIDRLRDEADRSGCPWLTLVEDQAHDLGRESKAPEAIERIGKVLKVGHRLGCASVAIAVKTSASSDVEELAMSLKEVVTAAERLELNLLVIPQPGLTETPELLTGVIRKVGGFRIGSMPDFEIAQATEDLDAYLRSLTPYASALYASVGDFDIVPCMQAVKSVGYEGALVLDYRAEGAPIEEGLPAAIETIRSIIEAED